MFVNEYGIDSARQILTFSSAKCRTLRTLAKLGGGSQSCERPYQPRTDELDSIGIHAGPSAKFCCQGSGSIEIDSFLQFLHADWPLLSLSTVISMQFLLRML